MYQDIYNCICQNTKKLDSLSIMSNLQPNCCLKFDFQKVDQHAEGKRLIRRVESDILKEGSGTKHPGRWGIVEHQIPSIKMLFKTNTKSHKHPSIRFLSKSKTQLVNQRKQKSGIQPRNRALPYRTWWCAASPIPNDTPVVYTTYNRTRIRNIHTYIYIHILTQSFWSW